MNEPNCVRPAFAVCCVCLVAGISLTACKSESGESSNQEKNEGSSGLTKITPETATKDNPFANSLGMKFVPVSITGGPTDGKRVLFSVWETRVKDYAAYAADRKGVDDGWNDVKWEGHKQDGDHPVVNVSWEEAKRFCQWLSQKEGHTYRLPTDHEWSCAVGIGDQEDPAESPEDKDMRLKDVTVFPWGAAWPPPKRAGNFQSDTIEEYADRHPFTGPVGSYTANAFGIHDLGGNVSEWCEDEYWTGVREFRVLRGGSWFTGDSGGLESSCRGYDARGGSSRGFRVVLSEEPTPQATPETAARVNQHDDRPPAPKARTEETIEKPGRKGPLGEQLLGYWAPDAKSLPPEFVALAEVLAVEYTEKEINSVGLATGPQTFSYKITSADPDTSTLTLEVTGYGMSVEWTHLVEGDKLTHVTDDMVFKRITKAEYKERKHSRQVKHSVAIWSKDLRDLLSIWTCRRSGL